jgi:hypothetical protein
VHTYPSTFVGREVGNKGEGSKKIEERHCDGRQLEFYKEVDRFGCWPADDVYIVTTE